MAEADSIYLSENLSRTLIDFIRTGIILTNREGLIRFTNKIALRMLGYEDRDLIGKDIQLLFLHDDIDIFLRNILHLTLNDSGFDGEALLKRENGETLFVHVSTSLFKDDSVGHELIIFAVQDISLLKKMERECHSPPRITELEKITDQLSHQIRNPIVSISGFALRLVKGHVSPEEYAKYSEIIHKESKRLEYFIDRIVELSKVHYIKFSKTNLKDIFKGLVNLYKSQDGAYRVIFPDPITIPDEDIFCDPDLIIHAVTCIIQNSIEAIKDMGDIIVSLRVDEHNVTITIQDSGEGISPESLPFIFDPFFTTKFNNLGLGLTMAKRIVNGHRGTIEVASRLNEGTKVKLIIPKERRREIRRRLIQEVKDKG